jgi:class 3 adenylate cyclase
MAAEVQHTFLFTDLVGFTALAAAEGDDRAADVALDLYARVRPLLADHGAEEVKTIGDGLMLRCDEPAAGVRLALRIVEELDAVPGAAVCRHGDWYGTTVNVAARLCAAAAGGQVLVSDGTCEAAGRLRGIDLAERELHWLKNLERPVAARLANRHECPVALWRDPRRSLFARTVTP